MLFTKVEAQLGPGCSDLPKSQVVHSHQLLSRLAEFPALLFKGFVMQGQKTGRRFTCSVRILSWCYVLCSHFSKLFPAGLTSVLSQGFLPLLHEGARGCGVLFLTSFGRAGGWDVLNLELSLKMAMKMTNKWPVQERGELGASWQEAVSLSAST